MKQFTSLFEVSVQDMAYYIITSQLGGSWAYDALYNNLFNSYDKMEAFCDAYFNNVGWDDDKVMLEQINECQADIEAYRLTLRGMAHDDHGAGLILFDDVILPI